MSTVAVPMPVAHPALTYSLEIVGGNFEGFTGTEEDLRKLARGVVTLTVQAIYEKVQQHLQAQIFKKATGNIMRAARWQIFDDWSGAVWMDPRIAPYAGYVEAGVQKHVMRYLLKAKRPIPVPATNAKTGKSGILFRVATEKWMGRPHLVKQPKWLGGGMYMTKGWIHPGYPGRFFMRDGLTEALQEIVQRQQRFVFQVMKDSSTPVPVSAT